MLFSMAFSQTELDALKRAYAEGTLSVQFGDRKVDLHVTSSPPMRETFKYGSGNAESEFAGPDASRYVERC